MSIPAHLTNKQSQIAAKKPPPPRRSPPGRSGISSQTPLFLMPQFIGDGSQSSIGGNTGVDLYRRRIISPAGLVGPLSPDLFVQPTRIDVQEELCGVMNSGSYFTNLVSNGISNPDVYAAGRPDDNPLPDPDVYADVQPNGNPLPDPEVYAADQLDDNPPPDELAGVDQAHGTYWKRIHDYFHANKKFTSDHSQGSLMNCWSGIQHDVNVFAGCLSKIEARKHSGCSVYDKIASACAMFKADDKTRRNFPYMHCWKILKDQPKWMDRRKHSPNPRGKRQKTTNNGSPSAAALSLGVGNVHGGQPSESAQQRPPGKKKEKQRLRQRASMEEMEYLVAQKKEADAEKEIKKRGAKRPLPCKKRGSELREKGWRSKGNLKKIES